MRRWSADLSFMQAWQYGNNGSLSLTFEWTLCGHLAVVRPALTAGVHVRCILTCLASAAFAGMKTIAKNPLSWPKKIRPKLHKAANKVNQLF